MSLEFILFKAIEEQQVTGLTGRINILKSNNKEYIGCLYLMSGNIVNASCDDFSPLRAVIRLFVLFEMQDEALEIVVEPELLSEEYKKLDFPNKVLKQKIQESFNKLNESDGQRPPDEIKLYIKPEFLNSGANIDHLEYKLLLVISDYNLVKDIYDNCDLFDFEITDALVSLRKKEALKVVEFK